MRIAKKSDFVPVYTPGNLTSLMNNTDFSLTTNDSNKNYNFITGKFFNIANKYGTLKKKTFSDNQAPFITEEVRTEI